jgi:hypothetical protein
MEHQNYRPANAVEGQAGIEATSAFNDTARRMNKNVRNWHNSILTDDSAYNSNEEDPYAN